MFGPSHERMNGLKRDKAGEGFAGRGPKLGYAASVLGIMVEQFQTELQPGKKMDQIITEKGMTIEEFHQKMLELEKEAISDAVESGKLTQEQANNIIQKMEQRFKNPKPAE